MTDSIEKAKIEEVVERMNRNAHGKKVVGNESQAIAIKYWAQEIQEVLEGACDE